MAGKKLNLAMVNENIKKFDEKEKITLSDGNYTYIYPHFSPSKISQLIKESLTDPIKAKEQGIDFGGIEQSDLLFLNMFRFFVDMNIPNDIKKKAQIFVKLVDSDYFGEIIRAFPEESIKKLTDALDAVNKNLDLMASKKVTPELISKTVDQVVEG